MINKKNNLRKYLIGLSMLGSFSLLPLSTISCSSSNDKNEKTQEFVNEQFEIFNNSILNTNVKNNLYFQNFNFDSEGITRLSLDQISKYITIQNLSPRFSYEFEVKKKSNDSISIEMHVKSNDSSTFQEFNPSNLSNKVIEINNVKDLSNLGDLENIYSQWNSYSNSLIITNLLNGEILSEDQKKNILPSYIDLPNVSISVDKFEINPNIKENYNINYDYVYDDINGLISITLSMEDKVNLLPIYISGKSSSTIDMIGFAKRKDKNEQIVSMFSDLSKTFSMNSLIDNTKKIPFLSSGINSIENLENFLLAIQNVKSNNEIKKMLEIIEERDNSWYDLKITTSANDSNGSLTIVWYLYDKFTGYEIKPSNITRTATFNNLLSLTSEIKEDGITTTNIYQLDNGYKAYNYFNILEISKQEYKQIKPSQIDKKIIDNQWIINETNINEIIPNVKLENGEIVFEVSTNNQVNKFKLVPSNNNMGSLVFNDVTGVLEIPFMLQIEVQADYYDGQQSHFINFLPPNGLNTDNNYNSSVRNATIKVGGFLSNDIEEAKKLYDYLSNLSNQTIEININNKLWFNQLLDKCSNDESMVQEYLINLIEETIINNDPTNSQTFSDLFKKYRLNFDFQNQSVNYDQVNNQFSTSSVQVYLVSSNDQGNIIQIPYYENGLIKEYPLVKVTVKYTEKK